MLSSMWIDDIKPNSVLNIVDFSFDKVQLFADGQLQNLLIKFNYLRMANCKKRLKFQSMKIKNIDRFALIF